MYKARTTLETEAFGLIQEDDVISEMQYEDLEVSEQKYFKYIGEDEDEVYNPVILADEIIEDGLDLEEFNDFEDAES